MCDARISIPASFREWEWYGDHKTVALFLHLLLCANSEPEQWKGQEIPRGCFVTSLSKLAAATGLSVRSVRTSLGKLASTGDIVSRPTARYRVIEVCRYASFADDERQTKSQANGRQNNVVNASVTSPCGDNLMQSGRQTADKRQTNSADDAVDKTAIINEFVNHYRKSVEGFCISNHCSMLEFRNAAAAVLDEWRIAGWKPPEIKEGRETFETWHLLSAARAKIEADQRKKQQQTKYEDRLQRRRGIVQVSTNPEDFKETF